MGTKWEQEPKSETRMEQEPNNARMQLALEHSGEMGAKEDKNGN